MNWNKFVRQSHRWLSIAFTLAVVANFVILGLGQDEYPAWLGVLTLLPLALLLLSGLYLFVLPYATNWRSARRTVE